MNARRYPRTLEEAFGPYTSRHIHDPSPRSSLAARLVYLAMAAFAVGAIMQGCVR